MRDLLLPEERPRDDRAIELLSRQDLVAPQAWRMLIGALDRTSSTLKLELYKRLVDVISRGILTPESQLPSTRALASELGISRNTIIQAYLQLQTEGFIEPRERSRPRITPASILSVVPPRSPLERNSARPLDWRAKIVGSAELSSGGTTRVPKTARYAFRHGDYDPAHFPLHQWREIQRDILGIDAVRNWTAANADEDDKHLIDQIRSRLLPQRGIWATHDEVLITSGTQSSLALVGQLLLGPGFQCATEEPGNQETLAALRLRTANVQSVDVDDEGLRVADLVPGVSLLCCSPLLQVPTTVTMSPSRRDQLYRYARQNGTVIVEDDSDAETWFSSNAPPAMKADDPDGRIIYLGTFSRGLAPALRLGYLVAPREVVGELRAMRSLLTLAPARNNQFALGEFLGRGYYDSLTRRIRRTYESRSKTLQTASINLPSGATLPPIRGGSAGWLRLPNVDLIRLQGALEEEGVFATSSSHFYRHRVTQNALRLGFCTMSERTIVEAMEAVGVAVRRVVN